MQHERPRFEQRVFGRARPLDGDWRGPGCRRRKRHRARLSPSPLLRQRHTQRRLLLRCHGHVLARHSSCDSAPKTSVHQLQSWLPCMPPWPLTAASEAAHATPLRSQLLACSTARATWMMDNERQKSGTSMATAGAQPLSPPLCSVHRNAA